MYVQNWNTRQLIRLCEGDEDVSSVCLLDARHAFYPHGPQDIFLILVYICSDTPHK